MCGQLVIRQYQQPYPEILSKFQSNIIDTSRNILEKYPKYSFPKINSALINKYRDGNDSIRAHRDTPDSFGEYPTILVYSIGAILLLSGLNATLVVIGSFFSGVIGSLIIYYLLVWYTPLDWVFNGYKNSKFKLKIIGSSNNS